MALHKIKKNTCISGRLSFLLSVFIKYVASNGIVNKFINMKREVKLKAGLVLLDEAKFENR